MCSQSVCCSRSVTFLESDHRGTQLHAKRFATQCLYMYNRQQNTQELSDRNCFVALNVCLFAGFDVANVFRREDPWASPVEGNAPLRVKASCAADHFPSGMTVYSDKKNVKVSSVFVNYFPLFH